MWSNSTDVDDDISSKYLIKRLSMWGNDCECCNNLFGRRWSDNNAHIIAIRASQSLGIECGRGWSANMGREFGKARSEFPIVTGREPSAVGIGFNHRDRGWPHGCEVQ
jgi:hypothetical protein